MTDGAAVVAVEPVLFATVVVVGGGGGGGSALKQVQVVHVDALRSVGRCLAQRRGQFVVLLRRRFELLTMNGRSSTALADRHNIGVSVVKD